VQLVHHHATYDVPSELRLAKVNDIIRQTTYFLTLQGTTRSPRHAMCDVEQWTVDQPDEHGGATASKCTSLKQAVDRCSECNTVLYLAYALDRKQELHTVDCVLKSGDS
jgi:hypothetical protein